MNTEAELTELVLGYGGWLQPQPMLTPQPGQYVIASPLNAPTALPEALFPAAYPRMPGWRPTPSRHLAAGSTPLPPRTARARLSPARYCSPCRTGCFRSVVRSPASID